MTRQGPTRPADSFAEGGLEANRSGRLSAEQRRRWRRESRSFRRAELLWAAILIFLGIAFSLPTHATSHAGTGEPIPDSVRPFAVAGCLLVGAFLAWRAFSGGDAVTMDTRRGEVRSIEGAVLKRKVETRVAAGSGETTVTTRYVDVAGQSFEALEELWRAVPDTGYVRLFYLPRSRKAVSFERLPDPDVGEVTAERLMDASRGTLRAAFDRDRKRKAETFAETVAMMNRYREQTAQATTRPPPDRLDPRPLAEAIVGSWSNGLVMFAFLPDGTVTVGSPRGGRPRTGRWSVGPDGRLHAVDPAHSSRGEWVADAWVSGDVLTILRDDSGLTFRRVPG